MSAVPRIMRAVMVRQFGGVEQMRLETDVPIPAIGDREVLVQVCSSGVNPVDTYIRSGQYGRLPALPYTPGKDGAGRVCRVGPLVTKFKAGDRVFFEASNQQVGSLAEYSPVSEERVFPLAPSLTMHQGASIGVPYFTAYRALVQKARAVAGERVLVHGASGAVGLAAVQLAKHLGLWVAGTAGTEEGMAAVKASGADQVHNHRQPEYVSGLGDKFDVILEMVSNVNLGTDLTLMKPRGRTVVIGCRGRVEVNPRDLMTCEGSVIGCALALATKAEYEEMAAGVVAGVESGWVRPIVDKVFPLSQAGDAHDAVINSPGAKGKLVVQVAEE